LAPFAYLGDNVLCNVQTCPPPPPPEGACCWLDGHCTIETLANCHGDGIPQWFLNGVCSPNPCTQPVVHTGACCNVSVGMPDCTITTQALCLTPYTWLGIDVPCNAVTCIPVIPTERTSWGQIKNIYR
jgi:hypothetical protein